MKKYKTFGEFLAYIREHMQECSDEKLRFRIDRSDEDVYRVYDDTSGFLETIYPIEVIGSTVLGIDIDASSGLTLVTVKLYVH